MVIVNWRHHYTVPVMHRIISICFATAAAAILQIITVADSSSTTTTTSSSSSTVFAVDHTKIRSMNTQQLLRVEPLLGNARDRPGSTVSAKTEHEWKIEEGGNDQLGDRQRGTIGLESWILECVHSTQGDRRSGQEVPGQVRHGIEIDPSEVSCWYCWAHCRVLPVVTKTTGSIFWYTMVTRTNQKTTTRKKGDGTNGNTHWTDSGCMETTSMRGRGRGTSSAMLVE